MQAHLSSSELYKVAQPIDLLAIPQHTDLAHSMLNLMKDKGGVGLAAPQVGHSIQLFVMDNDIIINPKILKAVKPIYKKEGCLSFPGKEVFVNRPSELLVKYYDLNAKLIVRKLFGLSARVFHHEYEHLAGLTIERFFVQ